MCDQQYKVGTTISIECNSECINEEDPMIAPIRVHRMTLFHKQQMEPKPKKSVSFKELEQVMYFLEDEAPKQIYDELIESSLQFGQDLRILTRNANHTSILKKY